MDSFYLVLALAPYTIVPIIMFVPTWKIFGIAGKSKKWAFLQAIPYIGHFVLLLILAYSKWPAVDDLSEGS
ncbi:MAG: hypothetical protein GKS00_06455 [Alphaproteobacteria bacterium]|nr:hypothetical protein [Alphaproteobacteria bacterium]